MYLRYAERVGWKTEVIEATETDMGGYKDVPARREVAGHARRPARACGPG